MTSKSPEKTGTNTGIETRKLPKVIASNNYLPGVEGFFTAFAEQDHSEEAVFDQSGKAVAGSWWRNPIDTIRELVGNGEEEDVSRLITWLDDEEARFPDEDLVVITGEELGLRNYSQPAQDIIEIIIEEADEEREIRRQKAEPDNELGIVVTDESRESRQERINKLAKALGVNPEEVTYDNLEELLTYVSLLVDRTDELQDFDVAERTLIRTGNLFPETMMPNYRVVRQEAADCVLFSTLNLANAAREQGAMINEVTVEDMRAVVPYGQGTTYRDMGSLQYINYVKEKGFDLTNRFNWLEAIKKISQGEAGLVLRVDRDHAIAVVGVRQNAETQKIEFLVADSLPGYALPRATEPNKPFWMDGRELIKKTSMRRAGDESRLDNYLISWDRLSI